MIDWSIEVIPFCINIKIKEAINLVLVFYNKYSFVLAGLRSCGLGAVVGFGASTLYALWTARDKITDWRQFNPA